tara:strand:+ start:608 stop:1033 length:426 start_codon:yes stop_codon:yes gene_type:complete
MRNPREKTQERYFDFLKEIRTALHYTDKICLSEFIKKHKISKSVIRPLVDGKIIKTNGIKSKGCRYYWVSPIEPNIAMAKELIIKINIVNRNYKESNQKEIQFTKRGGKREGAGRKPLKEEIKKLYKKKISIAWGLIKIEY